jgi:hypothetical protein
MMGWGRVLFALGWIAFFTGAAVAETEHHYMIVFAYQGPLNITVKSHTFASFLKDSDLEGGIVPSEIPTISWLPVSTVINRLAFQPGHNFNLPQTVQVALRERLRIYYWGPFEITDQLYAAAMNRIQFLNTNQLAYKMIDGAERPDLDPWNRGSAINCIHALSDIGGWLSTGFRHGIAASEAVVAHLSPAIVNPQVLHRGVAEQIQLDQILMGLRR